LPHNETTEQQRSWAQKQEPTYPSVVLYTLVDKDVVDEGTLAVEMLVGRPDALDEQAVAAYIPSVDDRTICADDEHIILAIGPSFGSWDALDQKAYQQRKKQEIERLQAPNRCWATTYSSVSTSEQTGIPCSDAASLR